MSKDFSVDVVLDLAPTKNSLEIILDNIFNMGYTLFEEKGDFVLDKDKNNNALSKERALALIFGELFKDPFEGFSGIKVMIPDLESYLFFYLTFKPIEQNSLSICLIPINFKFLNKDNIFIDKAFYVKVLANICSGIPILEFNLTE